MHEQELRLKTPVTFYSLEVLNEPTIVCYLDLFSGFSCVSDDACD